MQKVKLDPENTDFCPFYPGSVVLVTAVDGRGKADICTVGAWSMVNSDPLMFGIALCARDSGPRFFRRYTTTCIDETGEFVINLPHNGLAKAVQICGSISLTRQPHVNKFRRAGLTSVRASSVKAPLVADCVMNIECRVHSRMSFSTHDWIIGESLVCHAAKGLLDGTLYLEWNSLPVMCPQE